MSEAALKIEAPYSAADAGFGLYVHWPFCRAKCPYCDFNSHVRSEIDEARWRRALVTEIDHFAAQVPRRRLSSIFFGGGTPSLMPAEIVADVIARAATHWPFAPDIEITLEANPNSAEAARFRDYARAGVNRLSLGVQALDDAALKFLGRLHGRDEAIAAIKIAREIFPRYSFDLIYARPDQDRDSWRRELEYALTLAGDHLSLYQLTIEDGTAFGAKFARGDLQPLDTDTAAELYEMTQEMTEAAGLPSYEISNHAKPGGQSRHNLVYWRYGDYVGVGPGAHGRISMNGEKSALRQIREPEGWLAAVECHGHATAETQELSRRERAAEMLMMGLRLREGVGEAQFERETGLEFADALDESALADLAAEGYIVRGPGTLRATESGLLRLNAVLAKLLA